MNEKFNQLVDKWWTKANKKNLEDNHQQLKITYLGGIPDERRWLNLTGSATLYEYNWEKILVDFGMFQGIPNEDKVNQILPINPEEIDVIVLTHAHLDHIGRIPWLVRKWFKWKIYATALTKRIAIASWLDTVKIWQQRLEEVQEINEKLRKKYYNLLNIKKYIESQELLNWWYRKLKRKEKEKVIKNILKRVKDNKWKIKVNFSDLIDNPDETEKLIIRIYHKTAKPLSEKWIVSEKDIENILRLEIQPLYGEKEVFKTANMMQVLDYWKWEEILPGIRLKMYDTAHIPWSAMPLIDFSWYRCLIAQDLGRITDNTWQREVKYPKEKIHYLQLESTYSGKFHPEFEKAKEKLISEVLSDGVEWPILIAAFSIDRMQLIKKILYEGIKEKFGNKFSRKIYWDSGLGAEIEKILLEEDYERFEFLLDNLFERLEFQKASDVKKFVKKMKKFIVISASWMLQWWAIMKYLPHILPNPKAKLILTWYQSPETLWWVLLRTKKGDKVLVNGEPVQVNCKIVYIQWFSSHADHKDLKIFSKVVANKNRQLQIILTHYSNPLELYEDLNKSKISTQVAKFKQQLILNIK